MLLILCSWIGLSYQLLVVVSQGGITIRSLNRVPSIVKSVLYILCGIVYMYFEYGCGKFNLHLRFVCFNL